jgi:hypothetical protein
MPRDFLYLIIFIFVLIIVIFLAIILFAEDYKQNRDKITFLNKKALIISVFMSVSVFFGFLSLEKNDSIVMTTIVSFFAFIFCYQFLWLIFDDPKYPDGNSDFEHNVQFVLGVQKNNYTVPFPGTVGMYKTAKRDMEQYMVKHGITKVGMGGGQIYYEFESLEAKDKYFQNVRKPAPEDNFWK